MDRLEGRFAEHDARELLSFDRMSATQGRIETLATQNRESLLLFDKQQDAVIRSLDEIRKLLSTK
jgi:hypothetical protein